MPNNRILGGPNINFNFGGSPQASPFGQGFGGGTNINFNFGGSSQASPFGQGFGGGPMSGNNPMMAMGQQSQMMAAMMEQMVAMMGMVVNMMLMKQMAGMVSSSPAFGGGAGGGTPGVGNFLGNGGGSGAGQSPAAGGASPAAGGSAPAAGGSPAAAVGEKTGNLVDVGGGKKVDSSIADNVKRMMADAKKDGINLQITSAHRSRHEQEVLYQKYKNGTGNLAAKPGTSNHESGLAIDFTNTPGAHAWLAKNAGRYGLKNLPGEPWHYSPSGK